MAFLSKLPVIRDFFTFGLNSPMKRFIFNPGNYAATASLGLLLLRIVTGAAMISHGYLKLLKLMAGPPYTFADPVGLGVGVSLFLAVFSEFFCSILLMIGLGTRLAMVPLIITMLVIIFVSNAGEPFGEIELAIMYLVIYVAFALTGAGRFSADALIRK